MNTKERIILESKKLFLKKGYDDTSIAEILNKCEIGKGTLYHYFGSKEAILDEVVKGINEEVFLKAKDLINPEMNVYEKIITLMVSLNIEEFEENILEDLHKPQNALFEEKSNKLLLETLTPIMAGIVEDGIKEGKFSTPYPKEVCQIIIISVLNLFDINNEENESIEQTKEAFIYNMTRLLGCPLKEFRETIFKIIEASNRK